MALYPKKILDSVVIRVAALVKIAVVASATAAIARNAEMVFVLERRARPAQWIVVVAPCLIAEMTFATALKRA